jgi:hypothetical protein
VVLDANTVEVQDGNGSPKAGVVVRFAVTTGGGGLSDTLVTTGANGRASTQWILGPDAATQTMSATVGAVATSFSATAASPLVDHTYLGREGYIEYVAGDLPIIITAPHGGTLRPTEIVDRTAPGVLVRDTNTEELARAISDALAARTGGRPHLIINRLHRVKLDANREIVEAAQGSRPAQRAWYEFQMFTEAAKRSVVASQGRGFYIDLHGHGHAISRVELGYLLTFSELELDDATLNATAYENKSSIRTLSQAASGATFVELLRGPTSFGSLLETQSFSAVPSQSQPNPGRTGGVPNDYFNGGYNTARHGSSSGGAISGVQIETHFTGLRDNAVSRARFGAAIAAALDTYLATHAGLDLGAVGGLLPR